MGQGGVKDDSTIQILKQKQIHTNDDRYGELTFDTNSTFATSDRAGNGIDYHLQEMVSIITFTCYSKWDR